MGVGALGDKYEKVEDSDAHVSSVADRRSLRNLEHIVRGARMTAMNAAIDLDQVRRIAKTPPIFDATLGRAPLAGRRVRLNGSDPTRSAWQSWRTSGPMKSP